MMNLISQVGGCRVVKRYNNDIPNTQNEYIHEIEIENGIYIVDISVSIGPLFGQNPIVGASVFVKTSTALGFAEVNGSASAMPKVTLSNITSYITLHTSCVVVVENSKMQILVNSDEPIKTDRHLSYQITKLT